MRYLALILCVFLLAGCAGKSATQEIISNHVALVDEALKKDTVTKDDLKTCKAGLLSAEQAYTAEIRSYVAERDKWRLATALLGVLLAVAIYLKVKP